jgi:hypothetical protein
MVFRIIIIPIGGIISSGIMGLLILLGLATKKFDLTARESLPLNHVFRPKPRTRSMTEAA